MRNSKKQRNRLGVVSLVTSLALLTLADKLRAEEFVLGGHPVRVQLVKSDGTSKDWHAVAPESRLESVPVVVRENDTIHALLAGNGIRPDVEAFALVYELNPKLDNLKVLPPGAMLSLPKLSGGPKLSAEFQNGFLAALTLDPRLKESFDKNVKGLTTLLAGKAFSRIRVAESVSKETVTASLRTSVDTLEFIRLRLLRRNGLPLSLETLEQLSDDAEMLRSTIEPAITAETEVSAESAQRLSALQRDIEIKQARFIQVAAGAPPDPWPTVKVIVRTLKAGQPIPNLRVVYVPEALKGKAEKVRPFDTLSSPCSRSMPEADYVLWAVTDGTGVRVSNELPLTVRKGSEDLTVDLTVLP